MVYYSLADDHIYQLVKVAHEHATEGESMATVEKTEYRLENLTCASCAMKFENNVKNLPSVEEAQVNFGASKLSFSGSATVDET